VAVRLEGKCIVLDMREGEPAVSGTTAIWQQIGKRIGAEAISLRVLEFAPGLSGGIRNENSDEVLYFLESLNDTGGGPARATVYIDGWPVETGPQTGIYLSAGRTLTLDNSGPGAIILISSQCPEPETGPSLVDPLTSPKPGTMYSDAATLVSLADRKSIPTGNRWYRVLVDEEVGSKQVTQFVGSIPPGRAPDHFHTYEEVLFILRGQGRLWAGQSNTPIGPGSCVYLPKGQVHCVENIGDDELRLLGVFYPAGSPSVRYDAD